MGHRVWSVTHVEAVVPEGSKESAHFPVQAEEQPAAEGALCVSAWYQLCRTEGRSDHSVQLQSLGKVLQYKWGNLGTEITRPVVVWHEQDAIVQVFITFGKPRHNGKLKENCWTSLIISSEVSSCYVFELKYTIWISKDRKQSEDTSGCNLKIMSDVRSKCLRLQLPLGTRIQIICGLEALQLQALQNWEEANVNYKVLKLSFC